MNKKRVLFYALCLVAIVIAVVVKQRRVIAKREKVIVSTFSEWEENGKPVLVKAVEKGDVRSFTKMTVVSVSGMRYEGYVPKTIQEKLAPGQEVFSAGEDTAAAGKVVGVADSLDINTGMFHIQAVFYDSGADLQDKMVVYVNTGIFPDEVCVPNEVLQKEGGIDSVWVAVDGRAQKRIVEVRERNGYGAIIHQGLEDGDLLIVQGFTQLSENDTLNILDDKASGEI